MRVPLSWLKDYVDVPASVEELVEGLPMLGLGIDGVERAGDDAVLDLEVASNRPDLLSLIGVARELAAWRRSDPRIPQDALRTTKAAASPATPATSIDIVDPVLCQRYIGHLIVGVKVAPSAPKIAARLEAAGVRPINNIVDITNYVMLEWGQPLHAFDLSSLDGHRIVVRPARAKESLVTLDGVSRTLDPEILVIADAERAVALAGIMGGSDTEINTGTHTVLLEAASFAPASVRRTSRRLGVRTEASRRFERGLDPEVTMRAARRAAALIAETAGGAVLDSTVDAYPAPPTPVTVRLRLARIARLLGVEVPAAEVTGILTRLGFSVRSSRGEIVCKPPVGRRDVEREEDVIEEVARHYGYERIPETLPVEVMQQGRPDAAIAAEGAARDILVRAGLTEALTVSLTSPRLLERFDLDEADPWLRAVGIENPLTSDHTQLRTAILPGLLEAARVNVNRRQDAVHLFEVGRIFRRERDRPKETRSLGIVMRGMWLDGVWEVGTPREATLLHVRGVVDTLARELHAGPLTVESGGPRWLHPGRQGRVLLGGAPLGLLGEIHPEIAAQIDLPGRTFVCELDLELLLAHAALRPKFAGVPRFPAVRRDLAVVAPADLPQASVRAAITDSIGAYLEEAELFDVYEGPPLPAGTRNLAYALTFRAPDRTLTGDEVDALIQRLHETLPSRLPVTIRT
jgi:phenylalanyl-tRNA synthetase beta chain